MMANSIADFKGANLIYEKYRPSGRGGDLWMRENKAAINKAVAELENASAATLRGKLLSSLKKRVGWKLFRA